MQFSIGSGVCNRVSIKNILDACSTMMLSIMNNPKPVIAAVQGTVTAAGYQLAAVCDLAVDTETIQGHPANASVLRIEP